MPSLAVQMGSNKATPSCLKSRTFRVTIVSLCTTAVAAIMASSIRVSDFRCLSRAHSLNADASIGNTL